MDLHIAPIMNELLPQNSVMGKCSLKEIWKQIQAADFFEKGEKKSWKSFLGKKFGKRKKKLVFWISYFCGPCKPVFFFFIWVGSHPFFFWNKELKLILIPEVQFSLFGLKMFPSNHFLKSGTFIGNGFQPLWMYFWPGSKEASKSKINGTGALARWKWPKTIKTSKS